MAASERTDEIAHEGDRGGSEPEWQELVARAVNDLSRILHAEIRLAELGIKRLIEQEIERALKMVIALGFLLCAAACTVGAAIIGLHLLLGLWWAAFAVAATASGLTGMAFFFWARARPSTAST
jgi:hypothetical protein